MKCFLHIGTEKTGTTTLQNFFDVNRESILRKGFIYTKSTGRTNNRALSLAAYNPSRRDDLTMQYGISSNLDLLRHQKVIVRNLRNELKRVKSNSDTIIFSSEHFQSRLTTIDEIERLSGILKMIGVTDISVILYLRRPADIATSLYSTAIISGSVLETPPPPRNPYFNNVCYHKNTIEKFSAVFGSGAMILRIFEPGELSNGSIIDDMLGVIGIPNDDSYEIPQDQNKSLSVVGINLLRHLNSTIPEFIDNKRNPVRQHLAGSMDKYFSNSKYIMPDRLYKEYDLEFHDSDNWVRANYFPNRKKLFSDEIPYSSITNTLADSEFENIANFIKNILDLPPDQSVTGKLKRCSMRVIQRVRSLKCFLPRNKS